MKLIEFQDMADGSKRVFVNPNQVVNVEEDIKPNLYQTRIALPNGAALHVAPPVDTVVQRLQDA